ncbi:hypothetical protein [Rhizobium terrae]|uniref:hypothetical protein n=1 Tax=Rhizobium terrae TaxID=2171756 RepID=UPI000E3E324C|nr:hypothetical protein [Rhizobium terrae]
MSERPEKITVVPHQDYITVEAWDDTVHISQEDYGSSEQTITIMGKGNLDMMIAALQKVREDWS